MLDVKELFRGRKAIKSALKEYGFKAEKDGSYTCVKDIVNGQFALEVTVTDNCVKTTVYDKEAESPYFLHNVEGAQGAFVGEVRAEYERVLNEISDKCFSAAEVYRESTAKAVISYARKKYGTPLEFLWNDENAVMRRKDNRKWYMVLMQIKREKLGLDGEGIIEIIDLLAPKEEIARLVDGKNYLPAYHMNKKSWITVPLDGRVNQEIICALVDMSYEIAKGKKK
ncbi:MAG: MmcQ/YjbR family DNA-binding protein [Clostridia bacterium]|nr:MmcQ/YjbR family DNA-binding protein [Clostridia bacterium]